MSMALVSSENQVTSKLNFPLTYRRRINRTALPIFIVTVK